MAGPYRSFDGRDLPAAARDSYGRLLALFRNCVKVRPSPSSLAFFPLSVCQRCTTTSTYFVQLEATTDPLRQIGGCQCGPTAQERFVHQLAALRVVQDWV